MALFSCGAPSALPKRIKKDVLEAMTSSTSLTAAEVKALYARFRRLAPSGYLMQQQFQQTMGVMGLTDDHFLADRMFEVFDSNQDGRLSFEEFATALAIMIRGSEDEKLKLSFKMVAGREAKGLHLADFQHLVASCNHMMSSLVAPTGRLTSDEDVKRLFHDLASESEGEEVISLDAYKAAAQENAEFLACLGIEPIGGRSVPSIKKHRNSVVSTAQVPAPPADCASIPKGHLEELQRRIAALQKALAAEKRRTLEMPPPTFSAVGGPPSPVPEEPVEKEKPTVDPWLSWWIPGCGVCAPVQRAPRLPCAPCAEGRGEILDCSPMTPAAAAEDNDENTLEEYGMQVQDELSQELDGLMRLCSRWTSGGAANAERASAVLSEELRSASRQPASRESEDERERAGSTTLNLPEPRPERPPRSSERRPILHVGTSFSRDPDQVGRHRATTTSLRQRRQHRLLGPKKGLAVHFGHENWNMVLSMMIGIRMAVGRSENEMKRELQPVDFIMKEKFSILPRLANIFDATVSKRVTVTRFIDYAPMVFQRIRATFGIHNEDYLRSVGPEQLLGNMVLGNLSSLSELSSEGKSGAFFYYTADGKYMMKTVTHKEQMLLKKMLKQYHDHIVQNPGTLLVRFLGLHCLSVRKDRKAGKGSAVQKVYFVVMNNMFNTPFEIHRRYDLKGSWVGRVTTGEVDPSVALKDVDFTRQDEKIRVGEERKAKLVAQIERDSTFLKENNVIDYSLLLGIYQLGNGEEGSEKEMVLEKVKTEPSRGDPRESYQRECSLGLKGASTATTGDITVRLPTEDFSHHEVPFHQAQMGGMLSSDQKALYFLGIIDILTPYDGRKHLEHWFKALRYDSKGVSCCPPAMYAERFNQFMKNAIA